jgi:hypothetical protein
MLFLEISSPLNFREVSEKKHVGGKSQEKPVKPNTGEYTEVEGTR